MLSYWKWYHINLAVWNVWYVNCECVWFTMKGIPFEGTVGGFIIGVGRISHGHTFAGGELTVRCEIVSCFLFLRINGEELLVTFGATDEIHNIYMYTYRLYHWNHKSLYLPDQKLQQKFPPAKTGPFDSPIFLL